MIKRIPWPREQESFGDIVLRIPLAKKLQKTTAKLDMSYTMFLSLSFFEGLRFHGFLREMHRQFVS